MSQVKTVSLIGRFFTEYFLSSSRKYRKKWVRNSWWTWGWHQMKSDCSSIAGEEDFSKPTERDIDAIRLLRIVWNGSTTSHWHSKRYWNRFESTQRRSYWPCRQKWWPKPTVRWLFFIMKCERNYSSSLNSKLLIPMRVIDFETLWTPLGGGRG